MMGCCSVLAASLEDGLGDGNDQFNSAVGFDLKGGNNCLKGAHQNPTNKHQFSRSHGKNAFAPV